jgi:hypothetical protein
VRRPLDHPRPPGDVVCLDLGQRCRGLCCGQREQLIHSSIPPDRTGRPCPEQAQPSAPGPPCLARPADQHRVLPVCATLLAYCCGCGAGDRAAGLPGGLAGPLPGAESPLACRLPGVTRLFFTVRCFVAPMCAQCTALLKRTAVIGPGRCGSGNTGHISTGSPSAARAGHPVARSPGQVPEPTESTLG